MAELSSTKLLGSRMRPSNFSQYSRHPSSPPQSTSTTIELMEPIREMTKLPTGERHETGSWDQETGSSGTESISSRRWITGVMANLPWKLLAVLFGTIAWFGGCIGVIFAANKTKIDSWAIAPTVILAILGPLCSIMLQYALSCGLVITWWSSALNGTTLGNLHRQWDHGTSILAAGTAGRHTDKLALAKVLVLSLFAVNPLLQRALTTTLSTEREDVRLSTAAATDVQSLRAMSFPDAHMDGFLDPVQLSPGMTRIMQQFTEREPITGGISGCTGNCSGSLTAAGIDAQCTTVRNTSIVADYRQGGGGATLVFETGTNIMKYQTGPDFNLTTFFAEINVDNGDGSAHDQTKSCRGVSTTVNCVFQHAVVAYPFSQRDGVITPATQRSRVRILSTEPTISSGKLPSDGREPIFGGLSIAAGSIINSTGRVQTMGKYGWAFRTSGPLTAAYLARGGDVKTCAVSFTDPTDNIIAKLNEIMFRVALAAPNASSPWTEFTAQQQTASIIYESRYAYLWGALTVTLLAVMAVVPTVSGFQMIGRPVSLSPIEIAKAFGSHLLQKPGTSNMTIEELIKLYQETQVQYTSVYTSDTEYKMGGASNRLQFALSGHGRGPQAQESFAG